MGSLFLAIGSRPKRAQRGYHSGFPGIRILKQETNHTHKEIAMISNVIKYAVVAVTSAAAGAGAVLGTQRVLDNRAATKAAKKAPPTASKNHSKK